MQSATPRRTRVPGRLRLRPAPVTLRVLLFASWADALGASSVELDLADGATAADVVAALEARAPGASLPRPAIAINRRIATRSAHVRAGDEIAVIPPVAGG